jgi:uncharacterized protein
VPATITLRVNIDQTNVGDVPELLDEFACLRSKGINIQVQLAPVVVWQHGQSVMERAEYASIESALLVQAVTRGLPVNLLPSPRASACMADEPESFALMATGEIHSCAMTPLVADSVTANTPLLGRVTGEQGVAPGIQLKANRLTSTSLHEECKECKFLFMCFGHCPKEQDEGMLPCPSYRYNLEDRMLLEFMRGLRRETSPT